MSKFYENVLENVIIIGIALIPLFHNLIGFLWKQKQKFYRKQKEKFRQTKKRFIMNTCSLFSKLAIMTMFIILAVLQIIVNQFYHKDFTIIIIAEFILIINYILVCLQIWNDANDYGKTTLVTQFNLFLQFIGFCIFAIIIYIYQEKGNFAIKHEDICCWIMFIARGLIKLVFVLIVYFIPQDTQLLDNIVSNYQYKILSLNTNTTTLIDSEIIPNRQQLIANESHYTFGFPDASQQQITNIEVQSFNREEKYNKKTILYEITFQYYQKNRKVYRSFREFLSFHNDLILTYPQKIFPDFPKLNNTLLSENDIEIRKVKLDYFMKNIINSLQDSELLLNFLNAKGNCMQYKGVFPIPNNNDQQKKKVNQQIMHKTKSIQSLIPETIWEGENDEDEESIDVYKRKSKKPNTYLEQNQLLQKDYQRFNSADNIQIDIDQQNITDRESQNDGNLEQFKSDSHTYDEEEKHSFKDITFDD